MSRMTAKDMTSRVSAKMGPPSPKPSQQGVSAPKKGKEHTIKVPKGGEAHVRKIEGGHLATVRDSGYNNVRETFIPESGQLRLE